VAADLSLCGLGVHLHFGLTHRFDSFRECLIRCAALRAIALMGALAIVESQVRIQVALQLFERFVERLGRVARALVWNLGCPICYAA
jgi:hypothetical protein